ncbi:glycogen/starch/alpha-glucan phosphorylase [Synechococcus sp. CB0101]|jgi:starch phosphorylase|uniref:glycogen/starch/alpha-glucan phosphorylase n=1 Tax=Synechococcus sp. CB0101 TaxID=232348 RepID=UPI0002002422|nr:glycogen/starch/alpha-glucan phosphorylase [Synechococcus sp. CB0101]QCH13739.1 glycogen/starch/alpha-glucan phosphorylase [Synechococcus sp. CB0101]
MTISPQVALPASYGDAQRTGLTSDDLFDGITEHLFFSQGASTSSPSDHDLYMALSYAVRDRLMARHLAYKDLQRQHPTKSVAYLSAEFLIGPQLGNNLLMLGIRQEAQDAMARFGVSNLDRILAVEEEPGLGNGGLGRLAACYVESLASLEIPATGYGIRYEFGIFDQLIENGWQVEITDKWLKGGWPWEVVYPYKSCRVGFGGSTRTFHDSDGRLRVRWEPAEQALGIPHDVPVLGYGVNTCGRVRLWRAVATESFDFRAFNSGDYHAAVEDKVNSETLSKVLYPNDGTDAGRRLRLKQQHFFVSCSLQDMLRSLQEREIPIAEFEHHWTVQLNDTHPAIAVAELMRLLVDEHQLDWDQAWGITTRSLAYTNHTLLPEALECWGLGLFASLLPRHLQIIFELNSRFLQQVRLRYPGRDDILSRVSLIDERGGKAVRMAHLAALGSHHINGVAALHSQLVQRDLFPEFAALWPEKFTNVTNGVTPRRWLALANPPLAALLGECLGQGWPVQPQRWSELERLADDSSFLDRWGACKLAAKRQLSSLIAERHDLLVDPTSLFDVQVKRIHEYKRQHLNALQVIARYLRIKKGLTEGMVPRTVVFAGKAAPGYYLAKLIIRLINGIADVVNRDPDCKDLLKVVFLADFNVKLAEKIYPAADLSEQISTAGLEASGTGNMKFMMNGAITLGTLDGANVEILEQVGHEHFELFGLSTDEVAAWRDSGYRPWEVLQGLPMLQEVVELLYSGHFSEGDRGLFAPLLDGLLHSDPFFVLGDFDAYQQAQQRIDGRWLDPTGWRRSSLMNTARSGFFSSDRSVQEYADRVWKVKPLPVELACSLAEQPAASTSD